jgi:hypothetical protein
MHASQLSWSQGSGWVGDGTSADATLPLYFGFRQALACGARYHELRAMFPRAHLLGCSADGQIRNDDVTDDDVITAALGFDCTKLRLARKPIQSPDRSRVCVESIGRALQADDLAGVFVLSDGLNINGSELVAGIISVVGQNVPLTGGLAGDGAQRLAAGAGNAAQQARAKMGPAGNGAEIAILVSCIGRRLLMGQDTIEEIEAAGAEIGTSVPTLGFYSYGEISPHATSGVCELHNQTMTVTTISEAVGAIS